MSKSSLSDLLPSGVWLFPDAADDLEALDKERRILVIKALKKIAQNPSAFGKELGNQQERPLAGFRSEKVCLSTRRPQNDGLTSTHGLRRSLKHPMVGHESASESPSLAPISK